MTQPPRLGIVTGLAAEARIARRITGRVALGRADALAEAGLDGLVSFGIAGGLDPALRPGTVVIARRILAPDGSPAEADKDWAKRLDAALPRSIPRSNGPVIGSDRPVAVPAEKAALMQKSGAVAVDMESHAVAAAAAGRGIPFLAVRAIADPAGRRLPQAALAGLDGRAPPVLAALLRRPADLGPLLGVARDYRAALRTLGRVALFGGPSLGLV